MNVDRLHDPRLLALPHPIRIDAAAGMEIDTDLFRNIGITDRIRPYLSDPSASTEWIINNVPGLRQVAGLHFDAIGGHNMGSFILTLVRARLRAQGDPILEVTAPLQTLLAETDLASGLPVNFLRSPYTTVYIAMARPNPLQVTHIMSGLHECEGAYIGSYTLAPDNPLHTQAGRLKPLNLDPSKPTRAVEIVITGSPMGKRDALDDASQDVVLFIQDEEEDLSSVLDRHIAFYNTADAYSHPGMKPLRPDDVAMIKPVIAELAKVLLYVNLPDAEQRLFNERDDLARRLRAFGKLSATRRTRLACTYNRILLGPQRLPDAETVPSDPASPTAAERHPMRPHWRRGHFRRIRYGEGFSASRLGWIRPVLVNATHLTTPMPPKPKPYRVR